MGRPGCDVTSVTRMPAASRGMGRWVMCTGGWRVRVGVQSSFGKGCDGAEMNEAHFIAEIELGVA